MLTRILRERARLTPTTTSIVGRPGGKIFTTTSSDADHHVDRTSSATTSDKEDDADSNFEGESTTDADHHVERLSPRG